MYVGFYIHVEEPVKMNLGLGSYESLISPTAWGE